MFSRTCRSAGSLCVYTFVLVGLLAVSAPAQVVTVDNSDPQFTVLYGTWGIGAYGTPNGTDYRFALTTGYTPPEPASAVEWRPSLPQAGQYQVSTWYVPGSNRATNAPYTIYYAGGSTTVSVNQQLYGQTWFVLGTFTFNAGTGGYVTLDNNAGYAVVIADAVRFTLATSTVDLTMAVSPGGTGTTTPAVGGPYTKLLNEDASISASAGVGYQFDQWQVSAGALPADPYAASTTVRMDQSKTVTAVFVPAAPVEVEFRGFWADAFATGFKSTSQIDTMISYALAGHYNAIIPEVLAFEDTSVTDNGHGAYWKSDIVPWAPVVSESFDPLGYLVQQAHAVGLEVHPWLVAFRVCSTWPPSGNATVAAHPEWLMVPSAAAGGGPAKIGGYYVFDPGSPDVQNHLMSIVHELCTNYAIDGIHWDYIRYTQTDAGYPADNNYARSTLKRFQASTTGESWDDFRRRTVTEVVRRAMLEIPLKSNPRQPLRHTAALVTWYPANSNFHLTRPYYDSFCDWEYWQSMGYLDATIPMAYFDETGLYPATYRAWVDNSVFWANSYGRHTFIGPGIYMNTFANSVTQMQYARDAGAHGLNTYSYAATNNGGQPWANWYPYVAGSFFAQPVPAPTMPWRDPATATKGTVYGRVKNGATGAPIDSAEILINGVASGLLTDGNGCYLLPNRPAGATGTAYSIGARFTGYADSVRPAVLVTRAGFTEANLAMGVWLPGDYDVDGDVDLTDYARFAACQTGPGNGPVAPGCDLFDFDADNDVDARDFRLFQEAFTG